MSIEPTCHYCGASDKNRCRSREEAALCSLYRKDLSIEDDGLDFGFTSPIEEVEMKVDVDLMPLREENRDLRRRLNLMYDSILPFLDRLSKSGDKDIHWPNRAEHIASFKSRLIDILEGN